MIDLAFVKGRANSHFRASESSDPGMTQLHQTTDLALAMLFCWAAHRAAAEGSATVFSKLVR